MRFLAWELCIFAAATIVFQVSLRSTYRRLAAALETIQPRGVLPIRPITSAVELLKQVKALSAREREKLFLAILALEEELPVQSKGRTKRVKWPDVEVRAKRIFGDRVLPNLVLLDREEAPF